MGRKDGVVEKLKEKRKLHVPYTAGNLGSRIAKRFRRNGLLADLPEWRSTFR